MEYLFLYLYHLFGVLEVVAFFLAMALIALVIYSWQLYNNEIVYVRQGDSYKQELDKFDNCKKYLKRLLVILLLIFILPCQKTFLLMGGVYFGKKIINNIEHSIVFDKTTKIIELELDKYIKEMSE